MRWSSAIFSSHAHSVFNLELGIWLLLANGSEVWQAVRHGKQRQREARSQETAEEKANRS